MREVTLHVFASVKGGVGKSTLAVTSARLLAAAGRPAAVIDLDLTGTSLADGLPLCAPAVDGRTGVRIDLGDAPSGVLLTLEETRARRNRRRDERAGGVGRYLPYVNDLMTLFDPSTERYPVDWFAWRHEHDDGVMYLPSSPHRYDVRVVREWMLHEAPAAFVQHVAWLIDHLLRTYPDLRDVVIDLPPGTLGFSHEVLSLTATIDRGEALPELYPRWTDTLRWTTRPFLVTTEDRNDLFAAVDYLTEQAPLLRSFRAIVNRRVESAESTRKVVRDHLPKGLGVEDRLDFVDRDADALGAIFRVAGVRDVGGALRDQLARVFKIEEGA